MAEEFIVSKCNLIVGYDHFRSMADIFSAHVVREIALASNIIGSEVNYKGYCIGQNCLLIVTEGKGNASTLYIFTDIRSGSYLIWEVVNDDNNVIHFTRIIGNKFARVGIDVHLLSPIRVVSIEYSHKYITNVYIYNYRFINNSCVTVDKYQQLVPIIPSALCSPECIIEAIDYLFYDSRCEYNFAFLIDDTGLAGKIRIIKLPKENDLDIDRRFIDVSVTSTNSDDIQAFPSNHETTSLITILRPLILAAFNVSS